MVRRGGGGDLGGKWGNTVVREICYAHSRVTMGAGCGVTINQYREQLSDAGSLHAVLLHVRCQHDAVASLWHVLPCPRLPFHLLAVAVLPRPYNWH